MVIDAHVHLNGTENAQDINSYINIIKSMDEYEIDKSVIFPQFSLSPDNLGLVKCVEKYPDRFIPFAWLNPHIGKGAIEELETLVKNYGFKGIKLHPLLHAYFQRHKYLNEILAVAQDLNITVTIHSGHAPYSLPWQIAELAEKYPKLKIIMDHMGMQLGYVDDAISLAKKHKNLYLGTTAMPFHLKIKQAVEELGSDRVLFGSDAPVIHPLVEMQRVKVAQLSTKDEEMVLGGTLAKMLNI